MYLLMFIVPSYYCRICGLLNALSEATDVSSFFHALWQCIHGSPAYRLPATTFLLTHCNKKMSAEDQVHCMGGNLPLVVSEPRGLKGGREEGRKLTSGGE